MEQPSAPSPLRLPFVDLTSPAALFRRTLEKRSLYDALAVLNATTDFRFTGVYRFADRLVWNVVLFDRQNPGLRVGEDVRLEESYCRLTARSGERVSIVDAPGDERLVGHAARDAVRAYCAVLLRTEDGDPLGTLCHFDVRPREVEDVVFDLLDEVREDVERAVLSGRRLPERDPGARIADFSQHP